MESLTGDAAGSISGIQISRVIFKGEWENVILIVDFDFDVTDEWRFCGT
jgi:hypothetical protein